MTCYCLHCIGQPRARGEEQRAACSKMNPTSAAATPCLWLPLPLELTRLVVHHFLDVPELLTLTSLSRGMYATLAEDRELWQVRV